MTGIVRSEGEAEMGRKVIILEKSKKKKGDGRERGRAKAEEVRVGRKQGKIDIYQIVPLLKYKPWTSAMKEKYKWL